MKQENIEAKKAKRKKDAVTGVLIYVAIMLISAAALGCVCFVPDVPKGVFWCFLALAVVCVLLIIPALCVLKERFKEIEGGELDAAGKY